MNVPWITPKTFSRLGLERGTDGFTPQQMHMMSKHHPNWKKMHSSFMNSQLKDMADGVHCFVVDRTNPDVQVYYPIRSHRQDGQFILKYSGLLDDVKDNLQYETYLGDEVNEPLMKLQMKLRRLQLLLFVFGMLTVYMMYTR